MFQKFRTKNSILNYLVLNDTNIRNLIKLFYNHLIIILSMVIMTVHRKVNVLYLPNT